MGYIRVLVERGILEELSAAEHELIDRASNYAQEAEWVLFVLQRDHRRASAGRPGIKQTALICRQLQLCPILYEGSTLYEQPKPPTFAWYLFLQQSTASATADMSHTVQDGARTLSARLTGPKAKRTHTWAANSPQPRPPQRMGFRKPGYGVCWLTAKWHVRCRSRTMSVKTIMTE
jgi:hypothetical protein